MSSETTLQSCKKTWCLTIDHGRRPSSTVIVNNSLVVEFLHALRGLPNCPFRQHLRQMSLKIRSGMDISKWIDLLFTRDRGRFIDQLVVEGFTFQQFGGFLRSEERRVGKECRSR